MKHGLKTNVTLQQLPTWHNISQRNTTKASINRHNTQTINTQKPKLRCKTKPDQTKQHNGEPQKRWLNRPNFIGVWVSTKRHILKLWPLIPADSKYTHTSAVLYGFIGKNVYIWASIPRHLPPTPTPWLWVCIVAPQYPPTPPCGVVVVVVEEVVYVCIWMYMYDINVYF